MAVFPASLHAPRMTDLRSSGRVALYADATTVAAHADTQGDPSLNWIDLTAIGRLLGLVHFQDRIVWIAGASDADPSAQTYLDVLKSQGVDCRLPAPASSSEKECLRCGHGWSEDGVSSELALVFALMEDASLDLFDRAVLLAPDHLRAGLAAPFARMFPGKRLQTLRIGAGARLRRPGTDVAVSRPAFASARLPSAVQTRDGLHLLQPVGWRSPGPRGAGLRAATEMVL